VKAPRNQVITFRLTEDEYRRVKSACEADRTSISALVRHTILQWVEAAEGQPKVDERLGEISERLGALVGMLNKSARKPR